MYNIPTLCRAVLACVFCPRHIPVVSSLVRGTRASFNGLLSSCGGCRRFKTHVYSRYVCYCTHDVSINKTIDVVAADILLVVSTSFLPSRHPRAGVKCACCMYTRISHTAHLYYISTKTTPMGASTRAVLVLWVLALGLC